MSAEDKRNSNLSEPIQTSNAEFRMGFVFHFGNWNNGILFRPILIMQKDGTKTIGRFSAIPHLKKQLLKEFPDNISRDIIWLENISKGKLLQGEFDSYKEGISGHSSLFFDKLQNVWDFASVASEVYIMNGRKPITLDNIVRINPNPNIVYPVHFLSKKKKKLELTLRFDVGKGKPVQLHLLSPKCPHLATNEEEVFLLKEYKYIDLSKDAATSTQTIEIDELADLMNVTIPRLQTESEVIIDSSIEELISDGQPSLSVEVAEYLNQYLMLIPRQEYDGTDIAYDHSATYLTGYNGLIKRNKDSEKAFFESLRSLHPDFSKQLMKPFFYLSFDKVMKKSWFLKTVRKLQNEDIAVKGFENLKKFKYHTKIPKFEMKISKGIDWFDIHVDVRFGDMSLPLHDIRNAILSGEQVIVDKDGRLCLLPDEWIEKFADIFRFGSLNKNILKVKTNHFTLLEDISEYIGEKEIIESIEKTQKAFDATGEADPTPVSDAIKATLRPYQKQGFEWLQSLDHFGWGGCLADDMGLGKTLQTIAFLQFLKEKYNAGCSLIVCPTSLIYNWESELKKFAPSLKYAIYYGSDRSFEKEDFENNDLIISSYGTIRSDKEILKKYVFHYIILDESQAIKNPTAKVTRACKTLLSKNRIILSGTPIQNNTFDLFTQMDFLNPGLLGSMSLFKKEFAAPIDRHQDTAALQKLKKITRPFILRRTKESVAPDLPDKNEMILWCSMDKEQREVYDRYKLEYQALLLNKIEEVGVQKSTFFVLEGMMRLRQICDSPALIDDEAITTDESIKMKELLREIEENTGQHKVLVFSQFTSMLSIIKDKFDQNEISYYYLDGRTRSKKRAELVDDFQNKSDVKVFLISLKAGGVGLNLTAADYVYLIDPWWNPSVENQAIDRTHRIGQECKVFAYRMICKDTIEERIMELQEKKKSLSKELISEEKSFVGSLTKEDIAFLFE